jgi:ankyrin repeat protein/mono/diheme cytochrome c family protein
MKRTLSIAVALSTMCAHAAHAQNAGTQATAQAPVEYTQHVKPVLAARCFGCHGPRQQQSGLRLDLRQNALRGGDYGTVIVPGNSAESKLILRVTGSAVGLQMPPTGPLTAEEIGILRAWIDQGADMPGRADETEVVARPIDRRLQDVLDAIHRHDDPAVRKALAADPSLVKSVDAAGSTPLMHAAYAGTLETMRALINAGADVNAHNTRNATALHWAVLDPAKMQLLLSKGADVGARTVEGRTALHAASMQPGGDSLVKVLLEAGADVNARSIVGQTPLFAAVSASLETTGLLLAHGADPNARAQTGVTPLMTAIVPGAVELLVDGGADAHVRGKKGETAIANAAARGDLAAVRLLLEKGVDVNVPDYRGYTPLMLAAHFDRESPEIISLLLSHGADPAAAGENETAASLAAKRGDTEVARLLRSRQTQR